MMTARKTSPALLWLTLCLIPACYEQPEPVPIDEIISLRVLRIGDDCADAAAAEVTAAPQGERLQVCVQTPDGLTPGLQIVLVTDTGTLSGATEEAPKTLTLSGARLQGPIRLEWRLTEAFDQPAQLTASIDGYQTTRFVAPSGG